MNPLDTVISWLSPAAGLKRHLARETLRQMRGYQGAKTGRRNEDWRTHGTSANAEIGAAGSKLRNNSRDLVRNDPFAKRILRSYVGNAVGTGITPSANTGNDRLDSEIMLAFEQFCQECDAGGLVDFYGLQAQAAAGVYLSGEILARFRPRLPTDGLHVPLQVQLLEADFLDTSKVGGSEDTILQGIEFDKIGRRSAYWLFDQHPGEAITWRSRNLSSKRISAEQILHVFDPLWRIGQQRGVTEFDAIMMRLRDIGDYDEAELMRKKIESCLSVFVTGDSATPAPIGPTSKDGNGRRIEQVEPGMIAYLEGGQNVTTAEPKASGDYQSFMKTQLHAVAAGGNVTYEQATGDLAEVNFSSLRGGLNEVRRGIAMFQWLVLIPRFCNPVWRRFVDTAFVAGKISKVDYGVDWTPPVMESVDREVDADADEQEMLNGTLSFFEAVAARGKDPRQHLKDLQKERELMAAAGLEFPRPRPAAPTSPATQEKDKGNAKRK